MSEIAIVSPFEALGTNLRFGTTEDGTPFVVGADFARKLDYRDTDKAARLLDEDEKGTQIVGTPGGPQRMVVFYEDGIWELIFRSGKTEAKAIKRRVKEILAALRRGEIVVPEQRVDPGTISRRDLARMVLDAEDRADSEAAARQIEAAGRATAEAQVAELAPQAAAANVLMDVHGTWTMGTLANMFGIGRTALFKMLYKERILIEKDRRPYQSYAEWFRVAASWHENADGEKIVDHTSYIYPEGALRLHALLVKRGHDELKRPVMSMQLALIGGGAA